MVGGYRLSGRFLSKVQRPAEGQTLRRHRFSRRFLGTFNVHVKGRRLAHTASTDIPSGRRNVQRRLDAWRISASKVVFSASSTPSRRAGAWPEPPQRMPPQRVHAARQERAFPGRLSTARAGRRPGNVARVGTDVSSAGLKSTRRAGPWRTPPPRRPSNGYTLHGKNGPFPAGLPVRQPETGGDKPQGAGKRAVRTGEAPSLRNEPGKRPLRGPGRRSDI